MKFNVVYGNIVNQLNTLAGIAGSSPNKDDITQNILINVTGNELTLKATNYNIELQSVIALDTVFTEGEITVNAVKLKDVLGNLDKNSVVEFNLDEEKNLLILTKNMIVKSFKEIENDFSKDLNQLASKIIEEITGGKYEKLLVDENYNIRLLDKKTNELKSWKYLSSGTIDQFYLGLRLALVNLILENNENKILLLDDIFMRFDKNRRNHTKNILIKSMDELDQVLIFTNKVMFENANIINI